MANVAAVISSIRNIMRQDRGISGDAQRLEQLGWMLFLKIMDDKDQELEVIKDNYVSYYWSMDNQELLVEMTLTTKENNSTLVSISEKSRNNDVAGLKWLSGNSFGWSNFLACLKAYLEYGINLRKGAFDFMKK